MDLGIVMWSGKAVLSLSLCRENLEESIKQLTNEYGATPTVRTQKRSCTVRDHPSYS